MKLPGFTAETSLGKSPRTYRGQYLYGTLAQGQYGMSAKVTPAQLEEMEDEIEADEVDIETEGATTQAGPMCVSCGAFR